MPELHKTVKLPAMRAAYAHAVGARWEWVVVAMEKWERGQPPMTCTEVEKGKPFGMESSGTHQCPCRGCVESRCMAFFVKVQAVVKIA